MGSGADDNAPVAPVDATGRLFGLAAARMAAAIDQLEAGRAPEVRAAQRAIRELRMALWMLVDERTRLDRLRNKVAGLVGKADGQDADGDGATGGERQLDLVAARDEIGRRLAGLRAASDGG